MDQAVLESVALARARRRLVWFTEATNPQYRTDPVHALVASRLDAVVRGEVARLMVFAPPQHGKSELTSVRLPAFWLGHHPDWPVMLVSYGASLADSKSWQARSIMESDEFAVLFPGVRVERTNRSRDDWRLSGRQGGMKSAGVGGAITGHGAMLGIVDDPFENWQTAYSQTIRDRVWDWYRSTFRTRIWEGGAIVMICTRWHEDDLAGRMLKDQGEQWEVLRLPAVAESQGERDANNKRLGLGAGLPDPLGRAEGEPLAPGRFSLEALKKLEADVGEAAWWAQYQGTPRARAGNWFSRGWFKTLEAEPQDLVSVVRYWDKAATEGGGAHTCGAAMGRRKDRTFVVMDVVRGQWAPGEREEVIRTTAAMDKARWPRVRTWVEQEPGSGGKESADATARNLAGHVVQLDKVVGSKELRAEPFAAQAKAGNVALLSGTWCWAYLEELEAFPRGRAKDQVDASSGAFNKLAGGGVFLA